MRIHFQKVPWDLYVAVTYSVLVSGILLETGVGNPLGLLFVVFVLGYLVMAALLPRADEADWVSRVAFSLGLGFALEAFLGLLLNYSPFGITFTSATLTTLGASIALGILAYARRTALAPDQRLELSLTFRVTPWSEYSLAEKGLAIALVAILAITVPFLGVAFMQPQPKQPFTELYLLGPTGNFTGLPSRLNVSESASVDIVVKNQEQASVDYALRVDLQGVQIVINATTGANETLVLNETNWAWYNFSLANGNAWTQGYTFSIPEPGTWKIQFALFRDGAFAAPYREVDLLVRVP